MIRWLAGLFLAAHGLLHVLIWAPPTAPDVPFDPHRSAWFGDLRALSTTVAVLVGLAFLVSGIGYLLGHAWWASVAVAASVASIALLLLTFTPWWLAGLAINVIIVVLAWRALPSR